MSRQILGKWFAAILVAVVTTPMGSCIRTEHKIETYSKIDAHIVLDIRQIREEAQQVEGYVRSDAQPPNAAPANPEPVKAGDGKPVSYAWSEARPRQVAWERWLSWLDPSVSAAAAEVHAAEPGGGNAAKEPSEAEKKAIQARKDRAKAIDEALTKGYIGENDHGYVEVLIPADEKNKDLRMKLQDLSKDENADRRTIYLAIAQRRGGDAKALPTIEVVFADEIRKNLKKGQTFQAPKDMQLFQEFAKSDLGKQYPDAKPGQWLQKK